MPRFQISFSQDSFGGKTTGTRLIEAEDIMAALKSFKKERKKAVVHAVETVEKRMVKVKNLMSGIEVEIDEINRGGPCDPSTERYWSM